MTGYCIFKAILNCNKKCIFIINQLETHMHKRQFQDDSDFSVKKYYRRRSIKKRKLRGKGKGLIDQVQQTSGKWNLQETKLYVEFLKDNKHVIGDFKYRREMKIFKQMSRFLKSRTPDQCRSHHQKVQKLHKNIEHIIQFYQRKVTFGSLKKYKIQSNIVLVGSYQKQQKTTSLVETEEYFHRMVDNNRLQITIRSDFIAQY